MKRLLILLAIFCSAKAAPYSRNIVYVLEQLRQGQGSDRQVPFIGGCAVGYAGQPGIFYLLHNYLENYATEEDAVSMLGDKSPAVRLMGAKLLLHDKRYEGSAKLVDRLLVDSAPVEFANVGCIFETTTVGEIVRRLKEDHTLLGDLVEEKPIQVFQPSKSKP